ncbi:MAG: transposase zinc-binding domain-containing protein, partial [Acidobacteria bacterium]|nr:transposase zinc-binding domain-containing protein [Acidobacteriota bacterium]
MNILKKKGLSRSPWGGTRAALPFFSWMQSSIGREGRRRPPLYRLIDSLDEKVKGSWEDLFERYCGFWRGLLDGVVARFLDCGIFERGSARIRCQDCKDEYLLAFSCEGRGLCPFCGAKREVEFAAFLQDEVVADVGHAQWVFTIPKGLSAARPALRGTERRSGLERDLVVDLSARALVHRVARVHLDLQGSRVLPVQRVGGIHDQLETTDGRGASVLRLGVGVRESVDPDDLGLARCTPHLEGLISTRGQTIDGFCCHNLACSRLEPHCEGRVHRCVGGVDDAPPERRNRHGACRGLVRARRRREIGAEGAVDLAVRS